jgi:hypothetical protein
MTQTVLAINQEDCTIGEGNTAEEYEAIAVTLLRAAEAIRNKEEGKLECFARDGKALVWVHVHVCEPQCDERILNDPPAIARFDSMSQPSQPLRALSLSLIEEYRRLSSH